MTVESANAVSEPDLLPGLMEGQTAAPQENGDLVFTDPWQSRLFATTMRLHQSETIDWETFRQGLIAAIASHEAELETGEEYDYWGCWQTALEQLLAQNDVVTRASLDRRAAVLAARPDDHDHDHHNGHDHHH